ncbi:hypothetical protein ACNF42_05090 [Cuniculiplasma sp. SKW3]|uniref:hypothetical protein n=1 Tax=Cuniculiplasma sp. SKW3 TaxID=3400170 RepID=UPI003FD61338
MFFQDIDKKLNMRVILRVRQDTEFFNLTNEIPNRLPSYIYSVDGETWLSVYFPKGQKDQRMNLIYNKFKAIEREDSYVINSRINNIQDLKIINELSDVKSFVLNRADMRGGFLNIYARFHKNDLENVSELLSKYMSDLKNSRIDWLGPSPGLMYIMSLINSDYPISLLTYNVPIREEDSSLRDKCTDGIIEVKNNVTSNDEIRAIFYSDRAVDDMIPIDKEKMIYSVTLRNYFLNEVRKRANEKHILRLRHFVRVSNEKLRVSVFVPSSIIYDLYSIIYEIARNSDKRIYIENLLPFSDTLWDVI